ncbi:KH domain-containing protein HEN4-like [Macadamia integrifolia]|uniref:KH domain-containing protein HEN4-like n=1 Tax=Macadamia integrifolia TaxID=60698 RepID=UPI001C4FC15F|nr:KH domain-containing protein HEN4-like [Macadamia integrifolia]XP_042489511.1 KH domain-containing protein HEN4-like [Macadamia integrifolia]XP_042489512.1 KH domain-containing protein HEN4-like [Macadamia integrifolia]XP_042489513.1 KH domain-containing protein HEN4-like [Macadamia integrifolia]XP_042489514.1 KH domain-containing protein HEN4-like [Macadamia integrifolia]XP_042489515.1 KH domain-containing protein HEN4-like [Macadamia integrifolia]XP_042489516.1 KH domain-containing prote
MSFALTPSKRPHDRSSLELSGKGKWQKSGNFWPRSHQLKISPGSTVFRVLCPAFKIGGVIGKGGTVISQIRQETGAKVRVEEMVLGCDEQVIVIAGSDKETEVSNEQSKEDEDNNFAEDSDEAKEDVEKNESKEASPAEAIQLQSEKEISSVQKALLLVFERIFEGERENDGDDDESKKYSSFVVRLLVLSSQVGCILGKGGSVIKKMAAESGAQIRILPRDKLPLCASPADELVQLTGGLDAVKKALQRVSQQLLENPPRGRDSFPANKPTGPSSHPFGGPLSKSEVYPPSNYRFPAQGPYAVRPLDGVDYPSSLPQSIPKFQDHFIPSRMKPIQEILTFRLLCLNEKVGSIIGKGGTIIQALKLETGCDVKILEGVPDLDDRIIVISGPAIPDERISAAQDAVLRVQARIVRAVPDSKEKTVLARLLVSSSQVGCLLGKGGSIISEMRKFSGAQIRILGKDQVPSCASEDEEVVQITGEFEGVQEALLQITSRLKHHLFRDTFPSINHPSHPAFLDQVPSFSSSMERRELSPSRMFLNLGPSFHKYEPTGGLPHGGIHPHDDQSAFSHGIHRPGIPSHGSGRLPSSAPWGPQGLTDGGGPMSISEYPGGSQRRTGAYGGGSQPSFITNTTVEVVVPRSLVSLIYGADGGCLKQIRQISGAKITITDPRPGETETVIIISGAPDQTHAAQSLLQAFVMSGVDSP